MASRRKKEELSPTEAIRKKYKVAHVLTETEAAKFSDRAKAGDVILQYPPIPQNAKKAFQLFIDYYATIAMHVNIDTFGEGIHNINAIKGEIEELQEWRAKAERIKYSDTSNRSIIRDALPSELLMYEYVRFINNHYDTNCMDRRHHAEYSDSSLVYGRYILYYNYLHRELLKIKLAKQTPAPTDYDIEYHEQMLEFDIKHNSLNNPPEYSEDPIEAMNTLTSHYGQKAFFNELRSFRHTYQIENTATLTEQLSKLKGDISAANKLELSNAYQSDYYKDSEQRFKFEYLRIKSGYYQARPIPSTQDEHSPLAITYGRYWLFYDYLVDKLKSFGMTEQEIEAIEPKETEQAPKSESEEKTTKQSQEETDPGKGVNNVGTIAQKVILMTVLFDILGISSNDIYKKTKAEFIQFIAGNGFLNIYGCVKDPYTTDAKKPRIKDLQVVREQFVKLEYKAGVKMVEDIIKTYM